MDRASIGVRRSATRLLVAFFALLFSGCLALPSIATAAETQKDDEEELVKIETPTVTKTVWDGNAYVSAADTAAGEYAWYQVTGTLPSNLEEFTCYAYEFHDYLDEALIVDLTTVNVELLRNGEAIENITSIFEITLEKVDGNWELVVATDDLLIAASDIEPTDTVMLSYAAVLDGEAAQAGTSMGNYAYVRYTSKPFTNAYGRSVEASATLYTWSLSLQKVDGDSYEKLSGATFTIQAEDGRWVSEDGSLSDERVELEVDYAGSLFVGTLAAGTYTITEVEAPSGYTAIEPFELVVTADLTGSAPALSAAVNSEDVDVAITAESGLICLSVANDASPVTQLLSKTGDALARFWPAVAAVAVVAGCGLIVALASRRKGMRRSDD